MTSLERAIKDSTSILKGLTDLEEPLQRAARLVTDCLMSGKKVLTCGNGGSAADATHIATEICCRFLEDRRPYPAMTLTADGELFTAIGNDYSFDEIFARQVWAFGEKDDVLIGLTTSGKSRNVARALEEAKRKELQSICFLGRDGGFTKGLATIDLLVPGNNTARIQEAHELLYHVLCELVDTTLPKQ